MEGDTGRAALWIALALLVATVALRQRAAGGAVLALSLAIGMAIGTLYWHEYRSTVEQLADRYVGWTADVPTDPAAGPFGDRVDLSVAMPETGLGVRCLLPEDSGVELGHRLHFSARLKAPGGDERGRRLYRRGIAGTVSPSALTTVGWSPRLAGRIGPARRRALDSIATVPGEGGALLAGVVLGDRRRLSGSRAEDDFRVAGLTHLVAISGGHLVLVAAVVAWLLGRCGARRGLTLALVLTVLALYVVATGVQASAVRSWIMAAVGAASVLYGRRGDPVAALSAAVVVALIVEPPVAFDVGFRLSVAAVGGLLLFARLADGWLTEAMPAPVRWAASPLALTVTAQIATAPVSAATFGVVSLIAPLANLLVGPLITVVLMCGLIGVVAGAFSRTVGSWVLMAGGAAGHLAADIAGWLASVPAAAAAFSDAVAVGVACVVLAVAAWVWWPQPVTRVARTACAALLLLGMVGLLGPVPSRHAAITVFDVGQGDMILVRDGGHSLLVDAAPEARSATSAVARAGVRRLRCLVLTHLHADHTGGAPALGGLVTAERTGVPAGASPGDVELFRGAGCVTGLRAGDSFRLGETTVRVVWPVREVDDAATNEASVVLLVTKGSFSALLTGDAEAEVLDALIDSGAVGDIDVLKVGHHGSDSAVTESTLRALRPEVAIISVGTGNRYGHPHPSTLTALGRAGSRILRTDRSGDVSIEFDATAYRVRTAGDGAAALPCGTLVGAVALRPVSPLHVEGPYEPLRHIAQARLSHLRHRGAAPRAGACAAEVVGGRGGRSRLQHGHLRW